jgi:Na+/proline symporter
MTKRPNPDPEELKRNSAIGILICCGILAVGFVYVLGYTPNANVVSAPPENPSSTLIEVPERLRKEDTIGYR